MDLEYFYYYYSFLFVYDNEIFVGVDEIENKVNVVENIYCGIFFFKLKRNSFNIILYLLNKLCINYFIFFLGYYF